MFVVAPKALLGPFFWQCGYIAGAPQYPVSQGPIFLQARGLDIDIALHGSPCEVHLANVGLCQCILVPFSAYPGHQGACVDSHEHFSMEQKGQPTEHFAFREARPFAKHFANALCETRIKCHDTCSYQITGELRRSKYSVSRGPRKEMALFRGNVDSDTFAEALQKQ
jgi:hypothetical protein